MEFFATDRIDAEIEILDTFSPGIYKKILLMVSEHARNYTVEYLPATKDHAGRTLLTANLLYPEIQAFDAVFVRAGLERPVFTMRKRK